MIDDCPDVGIRAEYIERMAREYRAQHGALSVPPVETVKEWVRDALQEAKTAQLKALADYQHQHGYAAHYREYRAALDKLKEQEANEHH